MQAARARELLGYDPETGVLRWRVNRCNVVRSGDEAGYIKGDGYRRIRIDGRDYLAHRIAFLIMEGRWPRDEIDHINRVKDNNRWINLREVSHQENGRNASRRSDNTSGHTGICWDKQGGKWRAHIRLNGRRKHLGRFDDLADAIVARKAAELQHGFHANHGKAA